MRKNSCRNCGSELKVIELCMDCNHPLHYQRKNCINFIDDPVYLHKEFGMELSEGDVVYDGNSYHSDCLKDAKNELDAIKMGAKN